MSYLQGNVTENGLSINSNVIVSTTANVNGHLGSCAGLNGSSPAEHIANSKSHSNKNRICWDFVRGNCRRKNCRYPHVLSPESIVFCHDYQNSTCPRISCKFLHYTLQEEEYYRKFGEFPQTDSGLCPPRNNSNCGSLQNLSSSLPPPVSKEQSSGYLHSRFERQDSNDAFSTANSISAGGCPNRFDSHSWSDPPSSIYRANDRMAGPVTVFHQFDDFQSMKRSSRDPVENSFKRFREDSERLDAMQVIRRFEEEQSILRRRVEANEIKIAELRASYEYLMVQLRLNNQQCSSAVNPVTVTQTTSQPPSQQAAPPQVISGVSIAPVQVQANPIVSIATPQTQIIAANSGTPIAIAAANTSQGQQQIAITAQQNITSLTSTAQSLQPTHGPQILGTSQITLTPVAPPAAMGLTINTSQAALAMSNPTSQPIISYPVMTHSILPH